MQPSKGPRIYPRWRSKHLALTCSPPFFLPCLCSASGEDSRPEFIPLWVYFRIVETRIVVCVPSRVSATFSVARSLCSTLNFRRVNRSFLFPFDPPISSLLFKKHERETISSFVKTKTINIQRYLYHETFFSKQYITLLRIFRQIYIKQSQNGRRTTPSTEGVNGRGGNLANQFPYVVPQPLPSPVSGLPLNSVISPGCVARSINFFVPVARVPVHVHSSVVCTAGAHTHG